jgi:hypothetical protein
MRAPPAVLTGSGSVRAQIIIMGDRPPLQA